MFIDFGAARSTLMFSMPVPISSAFSSIIGRSGLMRFARLAREIIRYYFCNCKESVCFFAFISLLISDALVESLTYGVSDGLP
jgi:hypothetical protein